MIYLFKFEVKIFYLYVTLCNYISYTFFYFIILINNFFNIEHTKDKKNSHYNIEKYVKKTFFKNKLTYLEFSI